MSDAAGTARKPYIDRDVAVAFFGQLRAARNSALRDSEAFHEIVQAVERLGSLVGKTAGLKRYKKRIEEIASNSALAENIPRQHRAFHMPFSRLYDLVREGRNDAMHQGAIARRLTAHAIELSLVLEDALLRSVDSLVVGEYMVRNPICAESWQPISFVRQQMLSNSFSFLPVKMGENWFLVSDFEIAAYLGTDMGQRKQRLGHNLVTAALPLRQAKRCSVSTSHQEALSLLASDQRPILVCPTEGHAPTLLGIVTSFDLL